MGRIRQEPNPQWSETLLALGRRLRDLRRAAGLTQSELAARLGRTGSAAKSGISQVEHGRYYGVTLNFVIDYVNACGADHTALRDILDAYTSRPPPLLELADQQLAAVLDGASDRERRRALNYYIGLRTGAGKSAANQQELERAVQAAGRQAVAVRRDKELKKAIVGVLDELHIGQREPLAINIMAFGRRLFAVLRRTRNSKPAVRERQLAALDHWAEQHQLSPDPFARASQAILALFAAMSERGELD
jgi:transcriptional regulator with XRE-family HTH domain